MHPRTPRALGIPTVAALLAAAVMTTAPAQALPQSGPDFTRGDRIPDRADHDWSLGALGVRGWMHSEKLTTETARQILVTEVDPAGPAADALQRGDVILGVGSDIPFSSDPRPTFGRALTAAESGSGRVRLSRWRDGKTRTITVTVPTLGKYGRTAPYGCEKSERILELGCAALAERMQDGSYRENPIPRALNALALLASGDPRYLPLVKREAEWAAEFDTNGFKTWYFGYVGILLAEYVIATGDESVKPGLRRLMLDAARGQSLVGSWGHKFAGDNGLLRGYGMMNAPGIPLTTALVLSRMAGVDEPEIDRAIERSVRLLRYYVGKGAIPYGDHTPWMQTHEDNGKCGMAAVLFSLLGDVEAASFFARMAVASHGAERDCGHTGNFFNVFWALPAVALAGPEATGAWMDEFGAWYFDLARTHDHTFVHLGPPQERRDSYAKWDATGAYLLAFALPRKKLHVTGRTPSIVPMVSRKEAEALIEAGRGWSNRDRSSAYAALDKAQLLERLGSWSPIVRDRAASEYARYGKKGSGDDRAVEDLLAMLRTNGKGRVSDDDLHACYGACTALGKLRGAAAEAVPVLVDLLGADDMSLRMHAAEALAGIGAPARTAVPVLLQRLALSEYDGDPRGMEQRVLCDALFDRRSGLLGRSIDGVDRDALYAAIRSGLQNEDGRTRSTVSNVYDRLQFEEIEPLLPAIRAATTESAPSGIMFADGVRVAGLGVLSKHRVREGMRACVEYIHNQKKHGSEKRVPQVLKLLEAYGAHAKDVIPDLERVAADFEDGEDDYPRKQSLSKAKMVREAIERIRRSSARPALRSVE